MAPGILVVVSDMFVSKSHATTWKATDKGTYILVHCFHVFLKIRSLQNHGKVISDVESSRNRYLFRLKRRFYTFENVEVQPSTSHLNSPGEESSS